MEICCRTFLSCTKSQFQFVDTATSPAAVKSDVLNEVVMCTSSSVKVEANSWIIIKSLSYNLYVKACELSTQLLTTLREILRSAYENGEYEGKGVASNDINTRAHNSGFMRVTVLIFDICSFWLWIPAQTHPHSAGKYFKFVGISIIRITIMSVTGIIISSYLCTIALLTCYFFS